MCSSPASSGKALSEEELRQRASKFAYDRLKDRQKGKAVITGPTGEPLKPTSINPDSWSVVQTDQGWLLKRYLTRDIWQVVDCRNDGSRADVFYEIGPEVDPDE